MTASRKVLVVDDEEAIRVALARTLSREGYAVTAAETPLQALELLRQNAFDMALSDHLMPGMTGVELLAMVRDRHPDCLRVLLTGHAEMDAAPRCTPGLRFYQWMMEKDRRARLENQDRLRELRMTSADVQIFCGHDAVEFERLTRRPAVERRAPKKEIPWRDMTWQARSS